MPVDVARRLFTVGDYERMGEAGILGPEDRVELIEGEILQMSPPGNPHVACSHRANTLFTEAFGRRVIVSVQNPVRLDPYNEPQPDVMVLRPEPDFYRTRRVGPEDVFLLVEISDTTLDFDRKVKLPHYSRSGVPEVWIEDLNHEALMVFRDPEDEQYRTALTLGKDDTVSLAAFPDKVFQVGDLLG